MPEQSSRERYEALSKVSRAISEYREPRELFRALADELRHAVNFSFIALFLYDEATNTIHNPVLETVSGPGFAIPSGFPAEETITWWVFQHGEPVIIQSREEETRFPRMMELYRSYGVQSACVLPLATAHRRLGSLTFGLEQPGGYSDDDVRYLSVIADQVALAVDNALHNQDQQRVKAHFEQLFELAPQAIVLRDFQNRILRVNKEFTALFGFTAEEVVGRNMREVVVPEERWEESEKINEALKRGERVNAELIRKRKDGTLFHVALVAAPVSVSGSEAEIYAMYRDISKRKQAENALKRSEAYLAEGQRLSHTGSWARSVATGEIFFSQEAFRIFGFDPGQVKPTLETVLSRVHPEDRDSVRQTINEAIQQRTDFERDYRIILDSGTIRQIHVLGHPVTNGAGELIEFVGTLIDITDQYQSRRALEEALEEIKDLRDQLYQENVALREEIGQTAMFEEIVGKSDALRAVLSQVEAIAPTESTVLIYGETGTGKELVARAIHNLSPRRANAFVKLNCASIPTGLLESELFGHEKGAFTGAIMQRIGRFELANRGTIFLDEIGELPLELQPKLLRVLQEREFERLGSSRTLRTDARLIAATNRDLEKMVEAGTFRSDLFYRLNVIPIRVPPLRERPEDVPLLVQHFTELFSRRMNKTIRSIPPQTMGALVRYRWPGNVRELQNVIERAVILSVNDVLRVPAAELKAEVRPAQHGTAERLQPPDRERVLQALRESKGRVGGADGAAARLGLKRTTLIALMKRLGIAPRTVTHHF